MMVRSSKKWTDVKTLFVLHVLGFLFVTVYGSLLHILAQAMPNIIGRLLFPTNYSLWEQGKRLLVGLSLWFFIEHLIVGRKIKGFVFIHTVIPVAATFALMIVFLSYSTLFGSFADIGAQAVLGIALILGAFLLSAAMVSSKKDYSSLTPYGILIFVIVALLYIVFTFLPPHMALFYDQTNGLYGPYWK